MGPGDCAVVGYNSHNQLGYGGLGDSACLATGTCAAFSIVLLASMQAGERLFVTDRGADNGCCSNSCGQGAWCDKPHLLDSTDPARCTYPGNSNYGCMDGTWEFVAPGFVPAGTVLHDSDFSLPCPSGANPTVDGCGRSP